jgi:hypothetical protein
MLSLLTTLWKPIALGYKEMQVNYIACRDSFAVEVSRWKTEVTKQQVELEELNKKKQEVVTKTVTVYKDVAKKVETIKKETTNEIKASIRPTDIVTVPTGFIGVYNSAIEGSRVATSNQGKQEVPINPPGVVGKTIVFDATSFTEVMRGNVEVYNEVAARYSALIDLVKGIEKAQQ